MINDVFINGKFFSSDDANISINDAGFLYGDGIFETLRGYKGKPFKMNEHIDRLLHSLRHLEYNEYFDKAYIESAVYKLLSRNRLSEDDSYIKIIVTRNAYGERLHYDLQIKPNIVVIAKKLDHYPVEYYKNGIKISTSSMRRNTAGSSLYQYKLLNYFENIYTKNEAYRRQSQEGIFLTEDLHVLEGSMSNIFYVKKNEVITPHLMHNILPGITRQVVIDLCRKNNLKVNEGVVSYSGIIKADEIFLTNSIMELMPVKEIDGFNIGKNIPGPLTCRLIDLYKKEVEKSL